MISDPYIQPNGTLINLLGISNADLLKQAETDIVLTKLVSINSMLKNKFADVKLLKDIHKYLFKDIYSWAGEFRTIPIYKEEDVIIPGISLDYANPLNIELELDRAMKGLKQANWRGLTDNEFAKQLTYHLTKIWKVHPFRDGNTRTTLAFASIFARQQNLQLNLGSMLDHYNRGYSEDGRISKYSIRDMFVFASLDEKYLPEPEWLQRIIEKSINRKHHLEIEK